MRDVGGVYRVALPDGAVVCARGRREQRPPGPAPTFGLCLGPDRGSFRPGWPLEWVDWPDFRTPRDPAAAAAAIRRAHARRGRASSSRSRCGGGTGRTGTAIACMAVLAGVPAAEAVAWTRAHYRRRAVETPGQRRWIGWFADPGNG